MRRFDFKLEKVLAWTETRRQIEEAKLESLISKLHKLNGEFQTASQQCAEFGREIYTRERIDSASLTTLNEFRTFLAREKIRVDRARAELTRQIEAQRQVLMEVKRKIALFDRLKQTQRASWEAEAARELQELADESFASKLTRERRGN